MSMLGNYNFDSYFYDALSIDALIRSSYVIPPASYGQYLQKRKRRKKKPRDKGKRK